MRTALLLLSLLLLSQPLRAQTTIVGRVTDRATGMKLPGVTVLLKGTANATTTAKDGTFTLMRTPADSSSHALVFSSVGYVTVEWPVKAADSVRVMLSTDIKCFFYPDAQLTLLSGLRHTPFGGQVRVYGSRFVHLPVRATIGYQTNFRRNYQQQIQLEWLDWNVKVASLTLGLRRQAVRNSRQEFRFTSHSLTAEADFYHRLPVLLLGAGQARIADERSPRPGFGYEGGARHYFQRPRLTVQALATRWPGYWQYQGEISRYFRGVEVGVRLFGLRHYHEISLSAGYPLP